MINKPILVYCYQNVFLYPSILNLFIWVPFPLYYGKNRFGRRHNLCKNASHKLFSN